MKISFVIPCYKSLSSSAKVVISIIDFIGDQYAYNFILIDDGSGDGTWEELVKIKEKVPNVKIIKHRKNMGESFTVLTGLKNSNSDFVITLDDDLRHPVKSIPDLIQEVENNESDIVYGYYQEQYYDSFRRFCSFVNNSIANKVLYKKSEINISGFKIMRKVLVEKISKYNSPNVQIDGLIYSNTKKVGGIKIDCNQNNSRYNLYKLYHQLSAMIACSPFLQKWQNSLILIVVPIFILSIIANIENIYIGVPLIFFFFLISLFLVTIFYFRLEVLQNREQKVIECILSSEE